MNERTARLASPTRLGLQSLRNIWQRLSVALMLVMLTATTAWATITGSGTQQDPYIIHNAGDWNTAGQDSKYYYNDGTHVYVELADDIDFSGTTFRRFGQNPHYTTPSSCYIHFDGKGHTIRNISMNQGSNNYAAPFGNLATGSTVSNLTVASSSFTAYKWVAGITCENMGTITNCHVESTVTLTANNIYSEYCGGIAAQNGIANIGTITNCTVGAKFVLHNGVNQQSYGGIVGYNYGASPVSGCLCYSTDVTSDLNFFRILIGHSYNNGDVVTNNYYHPVGNYGHGAPDATTTHVRAVSGIPSGVTSPQLRVSHGGYGYFPANSTITLTAPAHKLFTNDFSASGTGSSYTLSSDKTTATVTIATSDVTINATVIFGPDFIENSDGSYTIKNANGWNVFCDLLEENAKGYFTGKTVKLDDNISVTRMAGSDGHDFTGTFDGNKKTLTVDYQNTDNTTRTAPFSYVDGATIQNLVVGGSITGSAYRAAGVIGETGTATSYIINCVSSLTISGDRYTGGFSIGGNVEIEGCVFNGKINGSSLSGGFVGYSNSTLKIKNCLFAPQSGSSISGGTFYYNGTAGTLTNCYYTEALGTAQGTQARRVTGDQYVTTCTVSPKGSSTDTYDLSGITSYNDGIVRDDTFYYGDGDQVSLTLAHSDRNGYTFNGYTPSAGTLDGTTLTMPNADVTIGCTWTPITYTITYDLDGGSVEPANPTTYNVETNTFTLINPTRKGYDFAGWTGSNGTTPQNTVTIEKGSTTGPLTYTAHWTAITYNISYELDGGSVEPANPTTYNVETPDFTLTNPTKPGYTFTGWTGTGLTGISKTVVIEQGSTTHRTYTANYEFARITKGDLSFICTSGTEAKVTACNPSATSVTIPATVSSSDGTYTVTAIDATAFSGCTSLFAVILNSETPPALDEDAFTDCTVLNAIGVPEGTAAAYKATNGWLDYKDKIQGYDGKCGTNVYYSYNSDTKALRIFGTGAMKNYGFVDMPWKDYCTEITTVVINHGVTSIGSFAFYECSSLTSVTIPASVTSIDATPFMNCSSLETISVAAGNATYHSEGNCLIETDSHQLIAGCKNTVIPNDVTRIGYNAFYGRTGLTSVTIPASVTSIGDCAFEDCISLASVTIPASVTSICDGVFYGCTSLESVEIPASVTSIGYHTFMGCTSLESIEIPASVTSIDYGAFDGCSGVKSISVETGNTEYYSEDNCLIETASHTLIAGCRNSVIPDDVTTIADGAFFGCTSLESIEIPASVTSIGNSAFEGCTSLISIEIPASVTTIGQYAFSNCTSLTSIEIPDGVTSIGDCTFMDCTSLESVEIPASVTSIGYDAFAGCTSLESVEIPASVTTIGEFAFLDCTSLASVTIYAPSLDFEYWLPYNIFDGNAEDRKIYVFKNCMDTYKAQASLMSVDEDDILAITGINLRDNDDNSSLIAAANDNALGALDVTLKGRTLYKDGAWNTLCLPFNVTLEGSPLEGAIAKTLVSGEVTNTETNLTFGPAVTTLEAGVPYIIKWTKPTGYDTADPATRDIVEPTFSGVTVVSGTEADRTVTVADGQVKLIGYYDALLLDPENGSDDFAASVVPSIYYMTADNTLKHTGKARTLHTCRAYFQFDETDPNVGQSRVIRLDFGEDETTRIIELKNSRIEELKSEDGWYTVDGVKLNGKPTRKGLYIFNGHKVVIK